VSLGLRFGHSSFNHSNLIRHSNFVIRISALALGILCGSLTADDDLADMLKSTAPATSQPAQTAPSETDPLGTIKQSEKPPPGARLATTTLSDGTKIEGRLWTTLNTPFRIWIEETKSYSDIDLALIKRIDVIVLAKTLDPDWRWLKEGSDQKIYSGKKYPNLELAYKFTLANDQSIEGPVVAPIYTHDGKKRRTLALYKKYKGKLDETLTDLTYIQSITLTPQDPTTAPTPNSKKLPLIY
jgi:hypothetical protein